MCINHLEYPPSEGAAALILSRHTVFLENKKSNIFNLHIAAANPMIVTANIVMLITTSDISLPPLSIRVAGGIACQ